MAGNYYVVYEDVYQHLPLRKVFADAEEARADYYQGTLKDFTNRKVRDVFNVRAQGCTELTSIAIGTFMTADMVKEIRETDENSIPAELNHQIRMTLEAAKLYLHGDQLTRLEKEAAEGKNTPKDVVQQIKAAVLKPFAK